MKLSELDKTGTFLVQNDNPTLLQEIDVHVVTKSFMQLTIKDTLVDRKWCLRSDLAGTVVAIHKPWMDLDNAWKEL